MLFALIFFRAIFSPSYMRTYNKNKVDIVKERAEELQVGFNLSQYINVKNRILKFT